MSKTAKVVGPYPVRFVKLKTAQSYNGSQFVNDPHGDYSIEIVMTEKELDNFNKSFIVPELEAFQKADKKLAKSTITPLLGKPVFEKDEETGEYDVETDKVIVSFKSKAGGIRKSDGSEWTRQPPKMIDAKRNVLPDDFQLSFGDTVKVAFDPNPYHDNQNRAIKMSLNQLKAVQVITHTDGGESYSDVFDEEEGFVGDNLPKTETVDNNVEDEDEIPY